MNEPKTYIQEVVEHISVKRKERLENAVFGEIKEMIKDNEHFTTIELNEKTIVKALEKQIPKKPRIDADEWTCCPECDSTFKIFDSFNKRNRYCGNCGQALDWGDHTTEKGGAE